MMTERVLIVCNHYPPNFVGGAEIVAHRQGKMLRQAGWDVRVFAGELIRTQIPVGDPPVRQDHYDGLDITRLRYHPTHIGTDFFNLGNGVQFDRVLADFRPDVVHFHNVTGLGANLIPLAKRSGAKVVVTLHDYWGFCLKNVLLRRNLSLCQDFEECHLCAKTVATPDGDLPARLRRDFVMSCLDQADFYISPSRTLAANYARAGLGVDRIETISSGIDLSAIEPRPRLGGTGAPIRFLCSSHLGEHKGIPQLAEALKLLWARKPLRGRWEMQIAGHGHLDAFLRETVEEAGLQSAVALLGRVTREELLARLGGVDVVVLASIWPENEPVTLLEGIASGAGLIASRVGGVADLVEHRVNGLLYDARDPAALAAAMEELIVDADQLATFSRANLQLRPRFDEANAGARIDAIYRRPAPARAAAETIIVCGLAAPSARTIESIERAPAILDGRRLRLFWSRWAEAETLERAKRFWIFRFGWSFFRWRAAKSWLGEARVAKTLDLDDIKTHHHFGAD